MKSTSLWPANNYYPLLIPHLHPRLNISCRTTTTTTMIPEIWFQLSPLGERDTKPYGLLFADSWSGQIKYPKMTMFLLCVCVHNLWRTRSRYKMGLLKRLLTAFLWLRQKSALHRDCGGNDHSRKKVTGLFLYVETIFCYSLSMHSAWVDYRHQLGRPPS